MKDIKVCKIPYTLNELDKNFFGNKEISNQTWDLIIDCVRCMEEQINTVKKRKIIEINGLNSKEITFKLFLNDKNKTELHEEVLIWRFIRFLPHFYSLLKYKENRESWQSEEDFIQYATDEVVKKNK